VHDYGRPFAILCAAYLYPLLSAWERRLKEQYLYWLSMGNDSKNKENKCRPRRGTFGFDLKKRFPGRLTIV
jgi:hypothetical protein